MTQFNFHDFFLSGITSQIGGEGEEILVSTFIAKSNRFDCEL